MKMLYISKGIVRKDSTEQLLFVARGGQRYQLTGPAAAVWLNGRFGFANSRSNTEEQALNYLKRLELVETEDTDEAQNRYRILTRCVCCPAAFTKPERPMAAKEKEILSWLRNAGIRLTVAELVFLQEHGIAPEGKYLYSENRQTLIEAIYTKDTIADNLLEHQMETTGCRDEVVRTLMKLLNKKKILIL